MSIWSFFTQNCFPIWNYYNKEESNLIFTQLLEPAGELEFFIWLKFFWV